MFRSLWLKQPITRLSAALASCKRPHAALHNERKETPPAALCCSPPCGVRAVSSRFVICKICTWKDLGRSWAGKDDDDDDDHDVFFRNWGWQYTTYGIVCTTVLQSHEVCIWDWVVSFAYGLPLPVWFVPTELLGVGLLKSRWRREASIVDSQQQWWCLSFAHMCLCFGCKAGFAWICLGALISTKVCWMLVTLPSCSAWRTWATRPWHGLTWMRGSVWCGLPPWSWMPCRYRRACITITFWWLRVQNRTLQVQNSAVCRSASMSWQELPPWFWERQNMTRRPPGKDVVLARVRMLV